MNFSDVAGLVTELPGDIYKFTNMRSFLEGLAPSPSVKPNPDDYTRDNLPTLLFVDGVFTNPEILIDGVDILPLKDKVAPVGVSALAQLQQKEKNTGVRITVKKNTKIESPLRVLHLTGKSGVTSASIELEALPNSEITFIEDHVSLSSSQAHDAETLVIVKPGARVEHIHLERGSGETVHHGTTSALIERDATYRNLVFHIGGKLNRRNVFLHIQESGAHGESHGLYLTSDGEQSDLYTELHHKAPDTTSDQLAKGILDGSSRGIFTGKIHIHPDAQRVNSGQLNKNLLLSKKAQAHSQPQLEIFADDVKCSHGSTTGQLSPEEVFYFESRGIPHEKAKTLLALGFGLEVVQKIQNAETRNYVSEVVLKALQTKFHLEGDR